MATAMPGVEIIKSLLAGLLAGSVSGFLGVSPGGFLVPIMGRSNPPMHDPPKALARCSGEICPHSNFNFKSEEGTPR
jgi:hypothetical protein